MTDYKAIADRLVERGVIQRGAPVGATYAIPAEPIEVYQMDGWLLGDAEHACHDWRVAGRCMEDYLSQEFADWDDLRTYGEPLALHVILTYLDNTKND